MSVFVLPICVPYFAVVHEIPGMPLRSFLRSLAAPARTSIIFDQYQHEHFGGATGWKAKRARYDVYRYRASIFRYIEVRYIDISLSC